MTNEHQNQTNNQDTVEQNQNSVKAVSPEAASAPAAGTPQTTSPAPATDPSNATPQPGTSIPQTDLSADPSTIAVAAEEASLSSTLPTTTMPEDATEVTQGEHKEAKEETPNPEPETRAAQHEIISTADLSAPSVVFVPSATSESTPNPQAETMPTSPEHSTQSGQAPCPTPDNPQPETPAAHPNSVLPKLRRTRRRIGKIASLPEHLRNWVNEQLVQRVPAHFISKQLEKEGYPGITSHNVSNWRLGGFQDYLQQSENAREREKRWNSLLALAREEGPAFDAAALQMAIGHYHELLCGVQPALVTTLIASKPEYFFRLNTGLSSLMKAYQGLSRLKKNSLTSRLNPAIAGASNIDGEKKGGLTIEERDEVRRSLGIMSPSAEPEADTQEPEQPATPAPTEPAS